MVGRDAAHGGRRRVDDQHRPQVQGRPDFLRRELLRRDQGSLRARPADARDPVQPSDRPGALEPVPDVRPAEARVVDEAREERQGAEGVQAAGEPAERLGRTVHRHAVPAEGHDRLQAEPELLRPEVEVGRRRVHLLHERHVDGGRHGARQARLHRLAAVRRRERREREARDRGDLRLGHRRSRTSDSTRTRRSRRTGSCSAPASRRRSSTRSRGSRSSTSSSAATRSRGRASSHRHRRPRAGSTPRSSPCPTTSPRRTRSSTRSATSAARTGSESSRPRPGSSPSRRTR